MLTTLLRRLFPRFDEAAYVSDAWLRDCQRTDYAQGWCGLGPPRWPLASDAKAKAIYQHGPRLVKAGGRTV
jgi:hypothetical protein